MGGFRVTEISLVLAIDHGCFAQAVFCLLIALAMALSPQWVRAADRPATDPDANARLRLWTAVLVGSVYLQLVLGAIFRHTGVGAMGIIHVGGALVVGGLLIQAANYSMGRPEAERLARPTIALFLLYGLQVVLGVASYLAVLSMNGRDPAGLIQTYAPTLHVAVGAAILGTSFALAMRSFAVTAGPAGVGAGGTPAIEPDAQVMGSRAPTGNPSLALRAPLAEGEVLA
jgi:cytochrome c oxidase assembly protein subunit 15